MKKQFKSPSSRQELLIPEGEEEFEQAQEAAVEVAEDPAADSRRVLELGNSRKGCWKLLADGTRVKISDAEWQTELAHLSGGRAPRP